MRVSLVYPETSCTLRKVAGTNEFWEKQLSGQLLRVGSKAGVGYDFEWCVLGQCLSVENKIKK